MAVTSEEFPVNKQGIKGERIEELEEVQEMDSFPVLVESLVHEGSSFLSVIQKVEDDNGETLGYVAADIKERAIYYEYLEAVNDEKITRILLVDGNNEIVTSEDYSDLGKTFPEITDHDVPKMEGYTEKNGVISFFSRGEFSSCGLRVIPGSAKKRSFKRTFPDEAFPDRNLRGCFCGSCASGTVAFQGGLRTTSVHDRYH